MHVGGGCGKRLSLGGGDVVSRSERGGTLDCGGKRQRHAAFGGTQCVWLCFECERRCPPEIPSKGGVALSFATAVQGARCRR